MRLCFFLTKAARIHIGHKKEKKKKKRKRKKKKKTP